MAETKEQKIERLKAELEREKRMAALSEEERELNERIESIRHPDRGNVGSFSIGLLILMLILFAGLAIERSRLAILPLFLAIGLGGWIYYQYHGGGLNKYK